jgi:hypothetical protein
MEILMQLLFLLDESKKLLIPSQTPHVLSGSALSRFTGCRLCSLEASNHRIIDSSVAGEVGGRVGSL